MTQKRWTLAAAGLVGALGLSACGSAIFGSSEPASSLVISWSEGDHRDLRQAPDHPRLSTRLLDTAEKRDEFLAALPASIPSAERSHVQAIDLASQIIVLGVYGKCSETSHLTLDGRVLRFVVERDEDVACAWAPMQVEVWSVARTNLPTPILVRDQKGDPA
ncbi:MAG: hypothetical protein ABIW49_11150 [Knoellia sp.]